MKLVLELLSLNITREGNVATFGRTVSEQNGKLVCDILLNLQQVEDTSFHVGKKYSFNIETEEQAPTLSGNANEVHKS